MTLFRFTFMRRSHTSSSISAMGSRLSMMPALFTMMSIFPNVPTAWSTMSSTAARFETSTFITSSLSPYAANSSLSAFRLSSLRSAAKQLAPASRKRWTMLLPMPDPPPVMTATWFSRTEWGRASDM